MKPDRKVASGGLAGALSVVLIWILNTNGVKVPPEIASAITVIVSFAVSYVVPNSVPKTDA